MIDIFADTVCDMYQPGDIIMVHDYHLMMLPYVLRRRLKDPCLAFLLHTPCPAYELFQAGLTELPRILMGVVGSDVIAFQAREYFHQFADWCTQELRNHNEHWAGKAMTASVIHPMGIDASMVRSMARSEAVRNTCDSLRDLFKRDKIIISYGTLDRREETNLVLKGFGLLLALCPWWKERVVLLQITHSPATEGSFSMFLAKLANRLMYPSSSESGDDDDTCEIEPVHCYRGPLSEIEYYALLQAGDAAIFPYSPGSSMTAGLDYTLCRTGEHNRPIVSDTNPMRHHLPDAIRYKPRDVDSIMKAINHALLLSDAPSTTGPLREESDCVAVKTAEHWMNNVLRSLTEKLLTNRVYDRPPLYMGSLSPLPYSYRPAQPGADPIMKKHDGGRRGSEDVVFEKQSLARRIMTSALAVELETADSEDTVVEGDDSSTATITSSAA